MLERYQNLTLWRDLGAGTGVLTLYLVLFGKLFGGQDLCNGCPRYTWWNALSYQLFLFPLFMYLAFDEVHGDTFVDKLSASWQDGPREDVQPFMRYWHYLFFGYMVKDMVGGLYYLHCLIFLPVTKQKN